MTSCYAIPPHSPAESLDHTTPALTRVKGSMRWVSRVRQSKMQIRAMAHVEAMHKQVAYRHSIIHNLFECARANDDWESGDLGCYTREALTQRASLRYHRDVIDALDDWWRAIESILNDLGRLSGRLNKDQYACIFLRVRLHYPLPPSACSPSLPLRLNPSTRLSSLAPSLHYLPPSISFPIPPYLPLALPPNSIPQELAYRVPMSHTAPAKGTPRALLGGAEGGGPQFSHVGLAGGFKRRGYHASRSCVR